MPSQQGLQPWGPHGLRPSNSSLSLLISQALFPLYTNSSFRKGQEHFNQPPLVSASPFPSSLPKYYQLTAGFSSVLCLLNLSMSLFHGAWVWDGNHLLHCPSRWYRRFQTSLSSPVLYAQHEQDACLILECPLKKNKPTTFSNTYYHGQTSTYFAEAEKGSERSPYFKWFCLIFLSQRGRAGMFNQADKHIID